MSDTILETSARSTAIFYQVIHVIPVAVHDS